MSKALRTKRLKIEREVAQFPALDFHGTDKPLIDCGKPVRLNIRPPYMANAQILTAAVRYFRSNL
jgi:hypothetical protein